SGSETSMISSVDFSLFPLSNPGIISIPLAFLLGIVGTFLGKQDEFPAKRSRWRSVPSPASAWRRPSPTDPGPARAGPTGPPDHRRWPGGPRHPVRSVTLGSTTGDSEAITTMYPGQDDQT